MKMAIHLVYYVFRFDITQSCHNYFIVENQNKNSIYI